MPELSQAAPEIEIDSTFPPGGGSIGSAQVEDPPPVIEPLWLIDSEPPGWSQLSTGLHGWLHGSSALCE